MRTVGVDLSAEARGTGIAVIDWGFGGGRLNGVRVGADDAMVLAALDNADRAAIDCPLGWPEPFVDFLIAHRAGHAPAPTGQSGLEWRRELSVCALIARAVHLGLTAGPPEHLSIRAAAEGWIHLPSSRDSLVKLGGE